MELRIRLRPADAPGILAGLVQTNLKQINEAGATGVAPVLRGVIDGRLRYVQADPDEWWKDWRSILATGTFDCEDIAPAIAAELLSMGIPARPVAYEAAPDLWHVIVEYWDGKRMRYGDPSILGGMAGGA